MHDNLRFCASCNLPVHGPMSACCAYCNKHMSSAQASEHLSSSTCNNASCEIIIPQEEVGRCLHQQSHLDSLSSDLAGKRIPRHQRGKSPGSPFGGLRCRRYHHRSASEHLPPLQQVSEYVGYRAADRASGTWFNHVVCVGTVGMSARAFIDKSCENIFLMRRARGIFGRSRICAMNPVDEPAQNNVDRLRYDITH